MVFGFYIMVNRFEFFFFLYILLKNLGSWLMYFNIERMGIYILIIFYIYCIVKIVNFYGFLYFDICV